MRDDEVMLGIDSNLYVVTDDIPRTGTLTLPVLPLFPFQRGY